MVGLARPGFDGLTAASGPARAGTATVAVATAAVATIARPAHRVLRVLLAVRVLMKALPRDSVLRSF
jgi:hypothetical protein